MAMLSAQRLASMLAARVDNARYMADRDVLVSDIVYDSRKVQPGSLFVCWKGAHYDGHMFAPDAVSKGAAVLLCERYMDTLSDTPQIVVPSTRVALGPLAAEFFGRPSEHLRLIGVTGTNGKTTTTYLIKGILEAAGIKTGLIGTIANLLGTRELPAERTTPTTPEAPDIQRMLAQMVAEECGACTMEVSSHALSLHRTQGSRFSVGVFTNLTLDHLDYHATFEEYRNTKSLLFQQVTEAAVVNADDPNCPYFAEAASAPVLTYGIETKGADITATDIQVEPTGVSYAVHTPSGSADIQLALTGMFNVYNSLSAIAVGHHYGVPLSQIARGLAHVQVPGRFERVSSEHPFAVIIDYAHTPDGLENVLRTARKITNGRVIVVFGAGGDRDRSKRPLMGKVAAHLADYVVVTSDNPRSEDPVTICHDVEAGIREAGLSHHSHVSIVNRTDAIRHAIELAQPGDLVLIAGKGHETYQEIGGVKSHFDDREEARTALEERFGDAAAQTQ